MKNPIDSFVGYWADRWHYAASAFGKYRTPRKAPPFVAVELDESMFGGLDMADLIQKYNERELQRLAKAIPWVYANINRIGAEVSAADISVVQKDNREIDIEHDFEELIHSPNEFFGYSSLLQYTIQALMLDRQGAYWFLAPDSRNPRIIREIWPIPINKLKPVRHKEKFISHYEYDAGKGRKPLKIDPRYICRFFLPDPDDLWKSQTPLSVARGPFSIYEGITGSQASLYNKGKGVPLAVVSFDKNIGDSDFQQARQQIKEDWEGDKRLAVIRAGDMSVQTVGISNRDLEIVASQKLNRDEIDIIFMGIAWHNEAYTSSEGLKEANRQIKENVIYPLHRLLASQIQINIINPFYGREFLVEFEDVRRQDRSLLVQERTIYWQPKSVNEARRDMNLGEYENELLPGYGDLPFSLAKDPTFVINFYGLGKSNDTRKNTDPEVGNMPDSMAPEMTTNMIADGKKALPAPEPDIDVQAAIEEAQKQELKRYRTVVLRSFKRDGIAPEEVEFETDIIPEQTQVDIRALLCENRSEKGIREVFAKYIN